MHCNSTEAQLSANASLQRCLTLRDAAPPACSLKQQMRDPSSAQLSNRIATDESEDGCEDG
eukprot:1159887-Pelagomonas_calceolata.AAC.3